MKTKKQRISAAVAKRVGGKLGVDWAKVDLDQFRRGPGSRARARGPGPTNERHQ